MTDIGAPKAPAILLPLDCVRVLDEVRTKSCEYEHLWKGYRAGNSFAELMDDIRRNVDPDRPYFIREMPNGVRFAGDARDFPSVLHALYPHCNDTLIGGLIGEIGDRDGDVLDIGANIGIVAANLARHLGRGRRLHAFEPAAETMKLAAATLALNRLDNFTLTCVAVSDRDGVTTFQSAPGNSAIASVNRHDFPFLNKWVEVSVPSRRIDTLVAERGCRQLSLIKIDVEGHEMSVLRSAAVTIRELRPTIVYEYTPAAASSHGWTAEDSVRLLQGVVPFNFEALVEPSLERIEETGQIVPFPLPEGIQNQVNVFARPAPCARAIGRNHQLSPWCMDRG